MTWFRWPWHPLAGDGEAQAAMAKLTDRDPEVEQLGHELREAQTHNNFSGMVAEAITRRARGGS